MKRLHQQIIYFALKIIWLFIDFRSKILKSRAKIGANVDSASLKPQNQALWNTLDFDVLSKLALAEKFWYVCMYDVYVYDGNRNGNVSRMKLVKTKTVDFPLEAAKYKSNYTVSSLSMCGVSLMLFIQLCRFSSYWLSLFPLPFVSHFLRISLWSNEFKLQLISFFLHGFVLSVDNS